MNLFTLFLIYIVGLVIALFVIIPIKRKVNKHSNSSEDIIDDIFISILWPFTLPSIFLIFLTSNIFSYLFKQYEKYLTMTDNIDIKIKKED